MRDEFTLKGYRIWRSSSGFDGDRDREFRTWKRAFECPYGHTFDLTFDADAEIPVAWECRTHSIMAKLPFGESPPPQPVRYPTKSPLDHLHERRTVAELDTLLEERLAELRNSRV